MFIASKTLDVTHTHISFGGALIIKNSIDWLVTKILISFISSTRCSRMSLGIDIINEDKETKWR